MIEGMRHPVIEDLMMKNNRGKTFIPNDICMGGCGSECECEKKEKEEKEEEECEKREKEEECEEKEEKKTNTESKGNNTTTRSYILTGPNMGGKTTYLRSVALCVILAQMGCYVPATRATIGVVDKVFSRVGSADDIVNDRSTFFSEITETATILKNGACGARV